MNNIFGFYIFFLVVHVAPAPEKSIIFSTGSAHVSVAFAFSAQVFFRVVFKGASSCFLSGYLPGPDKEVRLPAVSAFNQRCILYGRTDIYCKEIITTLEEPLMCEETDREGRGLENKWIYVLLLFAILGGQSKRAFLFKIIYFISCLKKRSQGCFCFAS